MARPHAAALVEDALNRKVNGYLQERRGWSCRAIGYTGYGGESFVRVLGRVLLSRKHHDEPQVPASEDPAAVEDPDSFIECIRLGYDEVLDLA